MNNDFKLIIKVVLGSVAVVLLAIWGLSRMASTEVGLRVDQAVLVNGARFVKGESEAKVVVVKFSDMQCPVCKAAEEETKELNGMTGVKIVMRHYPLPPSVHKHSLISAKAVEAGMVLGKGWEMMDLVFEKQAEWSSLSKPDEKFVEYAKTLGLEEKLFEKTMYSQEVAAKVKMDADLAESLRLTGTPTFFVNGEQVGVTFVMDKVKQLLEQTK